VKWKEEKWGNRLQRRYHERYLGIAESLIDMELK